MSRSLTFVVSFLAGIALLAGAQKAKDAVAADPDFHHVVMENEHVRVFEGLASPGRTSPMHSHPPLVVVSLDSARLKVTTPDGKASVLDVRPGQVLWFENVEHSWELLSGKLHVVAVEVKAARKTQAAD